MGNQQSQYHSLTKPPVPIPQKPERIRLRYEQVTDTERREIVNYIKSRYNKTCMTVNYNICIRNHFITNIFHNSYIHTALRECNISKYILIQKNDTQFYIYIVQDSGLEQIESEQIEFEHIELEEHPEPTTTDEPC